MKHKQFIILIFTLTLILFLFSVNMFNTGYYMFDYGHNLRYLSCTFDNEISDISLSGKIKSGDTLVTQGGRYLIISNILTFFSGYILGIFIMYFKDKDTSSEILKKSPNLKK